MKTQNNNNIKTIKSNIQDIVSMSEILIRNYSEINSSGLDSAMLKAKNYLKGEISDLPLTNLSYEFSLFFDKCEIENKKAREALPN